MSIDNTTNTAWRDETRSPRERAESLLARLTLREKLHQLGSTWPGAEDAGGDVAPMQESFAHAEPFDAAIKDGIGHLTRPFGTAPILPIDGMKRLADLQRSVVAANRFGIPAIAHEECLTGFTTWTATVFPTSLAWGATFDPELISKMAAAIGSDMAAVGVHQGLAPVLDVTRDYRWGRVEETIGEDPVLVGEIGAAYVSGLQSAGIIATLKHFAGYSASRGGRNHAPALLGPRELADVILPPFERAVHAGVRSVMNSYSDLDGIPPASDASLLTGLLRDQWHFDGTVVSDYWAIPFLESTHHVAADSTDAGLQALVAGIDVELPHTIGYSAAIEALVEEGALDGQYIDRAALRVLTQKAELGLLDSTWQPVEPRAIDLDSSRNRSIARSIAEESVVVLANPQKTLPLTAPPRSIAVIGPVADDISCLFGCYSFPNHVLTNHPDAALGIDVESVLGALRTELPASSIQFAQGTDISGIGDAAALAAASDLTILVVGDRSGMFGVGTSGEGCDVTTLDLPGVQSNLVEAVLAASSEVILVVVSGRPYAIGDFAKRALATIQVFFPGEEGAAAIAGVISGRVEPSGRLPVQIPGRNAPQPGTYLAPPLALKSDGVSNIDPTPAFPFGSGQSYTTFDISDVAIDRETCEADGEVVVTARVTNTGDRPGWHIPQLYLSDPVASVTRPVRRLIGFTRIRLEPGESTRVDFAVPAAASAFNGRGGRRQVEPGLIELVVARDAADPGHVTSFTIVGDTFFVDTSVAPVIVRRQE